MSLKQPIKFSHSQISRVTKISEGAFLFASANNRNLSSISCITGLFFPHITEVFNVTSLCLLTRFLTLSLRMPCSNNDTDVTVEKTEAMDCKCALLAILLRPSQAATD